MKKRYLQRTENCYPGPLPLTSERQEFGFVRSGLDLGDADLAPWLARPHSRFERSPVVPRAMSSSSGSETSGCSAATSGSLAETSPDSAPHSERAPPAPWGSGSSPALRIGTDAPAALRPSYRACDDHPDAAGSTTALLSCNGTPSSGSPRSGPLGPRTSAL